LRKAALIAIVGIVAASCGGGGGGSSRTSPPPSSTGSGAPANCSDESTGAVFKLVQQNFAFHPKCVKVKSAQSMSIQNKDSVLHNITIPGTPVNVDIQPGTTFNGESAHLAPGTYPFFCKFHKSSGMTGTLVVTS
jgi:plastocyanin